MYGYAGKILNVNLTTGKITKEPLDPALAKEYIGGSALGAKLLFDSGAFRVDPLSSDNP